MMIDDSSIGMSAGGAGAMIAALVIAFARYDIFARRALRVAKYMTFSWARQAGGSAEMVRALTISFISPPPLLSLSLSLFSLSLLSLSSYMLIDHYLRAGIGVTIARYQPSKNTMPLSCTPKAVRMPKNILLRWKQQHIYGIDMSAQYRRASHTLPRCRYHHFLSRSYH